MTQDDRVSRATITFNEDTLTRLQVWIASRKMGLRRQSEVVDRAVIEYLERNGG